jgi:P27 family predicted phage terminase small subunit
MKPGPPPIPLPVQRMRGNPSHLTKQRVHGEPRPAIDARCPEPPSFLSAYAVAEWWSVAPELHQLGPLTVVDVASLAAYCQSYAHWREAEEALARMAANDPVNRGLLVETQEGNKRRSPLVKIAADAAVDMVRHASQFGLAPAARSRISVSDSSAVESKFGTLLTG